MMFIIMSRVPAQIFMGHVFNRTLVWLVSIHWTQCCLLAYLRDAQRDIARVPDEMMLVVPWCSQWRSVMEAVTGRCCRYTTD